MYEYIERKALRDALYDADAITMNGGKILNQWSNKVSCSVCHSAGYERFNYCPNCGAKMDGGVENKTN